MPRLTQFRIHGDPGNGKPPLFSVPYIKYYLHCNTYTGMVPGVKECCPVSALIKAHIIIIKILRLLFLDPYIGFK